MSECTHSLGIVAGGDQEVGQLSQLVLGEGGAVLCPVVSVGPLPVLDSLLDGGGDGLLVMEVVTQVEQERGDDAGHSVGEGVDEGAETQDSSMLVDDMTVS